MSSPSTENISLFRKYKSAYGRFVSLSQEGRFAVVTNVERGMRWTCWRGQDERRQCGRRSRAVLTSRRWGQPPGQEPGGTVAKKPGTPGRPRISRNTIAQGMSDRFDVPVVSLLVCFFHSHARLRVRLASGIPCALRFSRVNSMHHPGGIRRGNADVRLSRRHCEERSDDLSAVAQRAKVEAIHSAASGEMDCVAEPVIGRAFARPVGSQ